MNSTERYSQDLSYSICDEIRKGVCLHGFEVTLNEAVKWSFQMTGKI